MDRHAILRTSFVWERVDKPLQIVWKRVPVAIEELDLRGLPDEEQDRQIERIAARDRAELRSDEARRSCGSR